MPWSPTRDFACPLCQLNFSSGTLNKLSYTIIANVGAWQAG